MGGVAVELVHLASLYHDDVIDEATIRRNVESVNSRFGNLVAIVAGDYLLARSASIAADLGTETAKLLADTLGRLCQGQVIEVRSAFQTTAAGTTTSTRSPARRRPSSRASCRIGALTGGLPRPRSTPPPSTGAASAWSSRSATTSSTSPPPTASCSSRSARTWPRASTRCRRWWPWTIPTPGPTCGRCSANRWPNPNGTRRATSSWAPRHRRIDRRGGALGRASRKRATDGIAQPELRAGLSALVAELLSDLAA